MIGDRRRCRRRRPRWRDSSHRPGGVDRPPGEQLRVRHSAARGVGGALDRAELRQSELLIVAAPAPGACCDLQTQRRACPPHRRIGDEPQCRGRTHARELPQCRRVDGAAMSAFVHEVEPPVRVAAGAGPQRRRSGHHHGLSQAADAVARDTTDVVEQRGGLTGHGGVAAVAGSAEFVAQRLKGGGSGGAAHCCAQRRSRLRHGRRAARCRRPCRRPPIMPAGVGGRAWCHRRSRCGERLQLL